MKRAALIALFTSLVAAAADVAGAWKLAYTTENGLRREAVLDLKQEGDKLAGSVSSDRGMARIEDGKISGDEIWFDLIRKSNGDEIKVHYNGKVDGATLKLKMQIGRRDPIEITARKGV